MIKSAILFNHDNAKIKFVVIAENDLMKGFEEKLEDWQEIMKNTFSYEVLPLTFPEANRDEWRNLFKPCAAQRLFLPVMLEHTIQYQNFSFFYSLNNNRTIGYSVNLSSSFSI